MLFTKLADLRWCCAALLAGSALLACSLSPVVPTVSDERLEALVDREARQLLAVADAGSGAQEYRFHLAPFPRADVLGLSVGQKRIFISYRLAQLAAQTDYHRWMLRQVLAHEIGHEVAGHAARNRANAYRSPAAGDITANHLGMSREVSFQNYSLENELQADMYGMKYWRRLGWDCALWVEILTNFKMHGYAGDRFHPTDRRLEEARASCVVPQD